MTKQERAYCILQMEFLKPIEKFLLFQKIHSDADLFNLRKEDLEALFSRRIRSALTTDRLVRRCVTDFQWMDTYGIKMVTIDEDHYPRLLREIYDPPIMLLYRGSFLPHEKCISIVGTRNPSSESQTAGFELAQSAAAIGYTVVSGLAIGIDKSTHEGALAASGRTTAVLGCGVDKIYPQTHRRLAHDMLAADNVICSEYPLGTPPLKFHFPVRNRIVSGISEIIVLIEAPKRSGAMITARLALEQGKEVFVHQSGMHSAGIQELAEQGAPVVSTIEDIQRLIIEDQSHLLRFSDVGHPLPIHI